MVKFITIYSNFEFECCLTGRSRQQPVVAPWLCPVCALGTILKIITIWLSGTSSQIKISNITDCGK